MIEARREKRETRDLAGKRALKAVAVVGLVLLGVLLLPAIAGAQSYTDSGSTNLDDRALAIANELQCPVCQNVTVAYSTSTLAAEMRQVIRDKLQQGWTRDQIIAYFVDRYGEGILTSPPKHGANLLVWFVPFAGLVAGLGVVWGVLRANRSPVAPASPVSQEPLNEEDEQLLADALEARR